MDDRSHHHTSPARGASATAVAGQLSLWRATGSTPSPKTTLRALRGGHDVVFLATDRRSLIRLVARMQVTILTIEMAIHLAVSHLVAMNTWADGTVQRMTRELARWEVALAHAGIQLLAEITPADINDFMDSAVEMNGDWRRPATSTKRFRLASARLLFRCLRQLHVPSVMDPTIDVVVTGTSGTATRPLTDEEEMLGRLITGHTLTETRRPAAWALGQATASTAEQSQVTVADIDFDNARVWLHGCAKRENRWGALTPWGVEVLAEAVWGLKLDDGVVYRAGRSVESGQASACKAVHEVLRDAGYGADKAVRPGSLPAWAGRRMYEETGRIESVARAMGLRSLDSAAAAIGLDWR